MSAENDSIQPKINESFLFDSPWVLVNEKGIFISIQIAYHLILLH